MTYKVVHVSYCGMTVPLAEGVDLEEARAVVARRQKRFEKVFGGEVTWHSPWQVEFEEPEGLFMVPDECGMTWIEKEGR